MQQKKGLKEEELVSQKQKNVKTGIYEIMNMARQRLVNVDWLGSEKAVALLNDVAAAAAEVVISRFIISQSVYLSVQFMVTSTSKHESHVQLYIKMERMNLKLCRGENLFQ